MCASIRRQHHRRPSGITSTPATVSSIVVVHRQADVVPAMVRPQSINISEDISAQASWGGAAMAEPLAEPPGERTKKERPRSKEGDLLLAALRPFFTTPVVVKYPMTRGSKLNKKALVQNESMLKTLHDIHPTMSFRRCC